MDSGNLVLALIGAVFIGLSVYESSKHPSKSNMKRKDGEVSDIVSNRFFEDLYMVIGLGMMIFAVAFNFNIASSVTTFVYNGSQVASTNTIYTYAVVLTTFGIVTAILVALFMITLFIYVMQLLFDIIQMVEDAIDRG